MKPKIDKKRLPKLILIFFCVLAAFAVLWGAAAVFEKLTHYSDSAVVRSSSSSSSSGSSGLIPGLPLNTYEAGSFYQENGFTRYRGLETQTGVDVSSYQQTIDWKAVAAAGVDFAMIRVGYRGYTEGAIQEDANFKTNIRGALDAGLDVGVYFFSQAITADEAKEEADFVLDEISGYTIAYPVVFDWEDVETEARSSGVDSALLTQCALTFCQTVESAGYRPAIYFNQQFGYQEYDLPTLKDYTFWLAEYNTAPTFLYDFQMWQYSNSGTVDGIEGSVDLNLSFLDRTLPSDSSASPSASASSSSVSASAAP